VTFVFLHGPPAAGKLTIARELAARTGFRLFHNHLTVDLALSLYDFGTPGFVALREEVWLAAIRRALTDRLPGMIFTFNPESSVPQRFVDELFAEVPRRGGRLLSVGITASETEIERRLTSDDRRHHGKLVDLGLYRQLRASGVFASPTIPHTDLEVDSETVLPATAAARIAEMALPSPL
jgi:hypothetical protein